MKTTLPPQIERNIEAHVRVARQLKKQAAARGGGPAPFVTLSRQFGCEAYALAEALALRLDAQEHLESGSWQIYGRKLFEAMADQEYSSEQLMNALDSNARGAIEEFLESLVGQISDLKLLHKLARTLRATAMLGRCIIVGRGGALLTDKLPGGIHVRLVASEEVRLRGLVERFGWNEDRARQTLRDEDTGRTDFFRKFLNRDPDDLTLYHLVLNTGQLTRAELADQIFTLVCARHLPPGKKG